MSMFNILRAKMGSLVDMSSKAKAESSDDDSVVLEDIGEVEE
jgi:hypothetical protein